MAQQVLRVRVAFLNDDTLADNASHTYTVEATGSNTDITLSDIDTALGLMYNSTPGVGQTNPWCHYLATGLSRAANGVTVTYTDITAHLDGSPAGAPLATSTFTLGAAGVAQDLPAQDALTIAFRATYGTDIERGVPGAIPSSESAQDQGAPATHTGQTKPRARDRGRLFFGPLNGSALASTNGIPNSTVLADLGAVASAMCPAQKNGDADQWNFVVWSRRNAGVKPIAYYYVDENFTAQRRRSDSTLNRVHTWVLGGAEVLEAS